MYHNYCVIIIFSAKTKTFPQLQRSVQQQEAQLKLRSQSVDIPS